MTDEGARPKLPIHSSLSMFSIFRQKKSGLFPNKHISDKHDHRLHKTEGSSSLKVRNLTNASTQFQTQPIFKK